MAVIGLITNEGLSKSIEAQSNLGWKIYPIEFAVSDTAGVLSATRDYASMEPTWYRAAISSVDPMPPNTVQFICTIPPGSYGSTIDINEIYLIAQDNFGVYFLLSLGQPEITIVYDPSGSIRFRLQVTIANVDISGVYVFNYTQATEISEHNIDPNAHPDLRAILNSFGGTPVVVSGSESIDCGDLVVCRTSIAPIDLLITNTPSDGCGIKIIDFDGNAETNNITVDFNGKVFNGTGTRIIMDVNYSTIELQYSSDKDEWTFTYPPTIVP